ncbi:uncharacterized protein LOC112586637 isoform X4 [Bubalus bubalis]|uniref:uncharacterized protein LOC112586637 isoform X4 n=1 Tax=Bubalus bubalis TaxID=89462 RepID=UPI001E1B82B4|nr:uncharacterized protein LOC112586637 isoform X4 [Bubalus bubalis]
MRRDRRDGLGSLPPLHGARAGGGRRWGGVGVGTARPAAALPRPGNRAAAGAGPGMRTAASLAVKLTPGEGAGGQHPSPHPRRLSSATGL